MRVESVGYAAIKGTRHVSRAAVRAESGGIAGDRRWCLVDVARLEVLRTVRHPQLVALVAEVADGSLRLTAPGGERADGVPAPTGEILTCEYWGRAVPLALQDGPHAALASAWLGRDVRLAEAPPGAVVYAGAVSLVSAASVAALPGDGNAARFRPNVVVDAGAEPFAEDAWVGREVRLGGVVVRPLRRTPRCAVVQADPATGRRDAAMLEALARRPGGEALLGVDGDVVVPGTVRVGDPVRVRRREGTLGAS